MCGDLYLIDDVVFFDYGCGVGFGVKVYYFVGGGVG